MGCAARVELRGHERRRALEPAPRGLHERLDDVKGGLIGGNPEAAARPGERDGGVGANGEAEPLLVAHRRGARTQQARVRKFVRGKQRRRAMQIKRGTFRECQAWRESGWCEFRLCSFWANKERLRVLQLSSRSRTLQGDWREAYVGINEANRQGWGAPLTSCAQPGEQHKVHEVPANHCRRRLERALCVDALRV